MLEVEIRVEGAEPPRNAYDRGTFSNTDPDTYYDVLACGAEGISITHNVTLEIEITARVWAFFYPFTSSWRDSCTRNVIVHVHLP